MQTMGNIIKIKSGSHIFYIDGRKIYLMIPRGELTQRFLIQSHNNLSLGQYEYAKIVDMIYKKRIRCMEDLVHNIINTYLLVPTDRQFK